MIPEMISERHKEAEADNAKTKIEQPVDKIIPDQTGEDSGTRY